MRRRPVILLLPTLALLVAACGNGDDDGGTASSTTSGGAAATTTTGPEGGTGPAQAVWYGSWEGGAVARWNLAANSCDGVTPVGLSADLLEIGLGWVWVTDCRAGQLVRLDVETGEVTGRVTVGACPSAMVVSDGLVWLALPNLNKVIGIHPESGAVAAEGTSELDTPTYLAAGSLHAAGQTYYWRVDEVAPPGGTWSGDVWSFRLDDYLVEGASGGRIQGLAVMADGTGAAVLVGPSPDSGPIEYDDPSYPTQLVRIGSRWDWANAKPPMMGFFNYLAIVDGHYVATSKVTPYALISNAGEVKVPLQVPGKPVQGPPPPGGENGGGGTTAPVPWVWIPQRGPGNLVAFPIDSPPESPMPAVEPQCTLEGTRLGIWYAIVLGQSQIQDQASLARGMDRSAFPIEPVPEEPVTPTTPSGPRFSSCSVGYESSGRMLTGMEGKTEPGATVALNIEYGTTLYTDVATVVAGEDGSFTLPEVSVDDLGPPAPPAGATLTVVFTAGGSFTNACRLDVDT